MNQIYAAKIFLAIFFLVAACKYTNESAEPVQRNQTIQAATDLAIGLEEQPVEHQFGQPIAVRTDETGNIYVADRASKFIKVFDQDGNYIRSLGGRGRGPGEFQEMEFMEWTPEGHLVLMDRGNLMYTTITIKGDFVESFPYNLSSQFYPTQIRYINGEKLALFLDSGPQSDIPRIKRNLFHIYSEDFQELEYSLFPFYNLKIDDDLFV